MRIINFDRFFVEKNNFDLYIDIEGQKGNILNNHPEVFLLSCCLGYHYSLKQKIENKKGLVRKQSVLNVEFKNINYGKLIYDSFKLIAKKEKDIDDEGNILVNRTMEEYANGGIVKLKHDVFNIEDMKSENLIKYIMLNLD